MLAEVEDGLIHLIRGAPIGARLAVVGSLPNLDGEALVRRFGSDAPAVYVTPGRIQTREGQWLPTFGLGCVARNARGQAAARKGDGMIVGLYTIVEHVMAACDGATAGGINWTVNGIDYLDDATLAQNGLFIATVQLRAAGWIDMPEGIDEQSLADFKRLRADYDIPPHDSNAAHHQWAGDPPDHDTTVPDMTDTIHLQP